jgi:hypothetical protein
MCKTSRRTLTGREVISTPRHRKYSSWGTTVLHKLCHWGNFKHGVTEKEEAGIAFEVATYGRNTG